MLSGQSLYSINPETKLVTKLLTLTSGEDFFGPDLPSDYIELVDAYTIKYTVFSTSNKANSYQFDVIENRIFVLP